MNSNTFRKILLSLTIVITSVCSLASIGKAGEKFPFNNGETIIFFGDSITQNGTYVNYFEAYLLTRFPDQNFRVINHGISSETISGTSEPDHDPRRPWAHPRFERDIANWKPDWVISCFGMNDGNYHPFVEEKFEKYKAGNLRLIKRVKEEANAKLIFMTPPPFDPYRSKRSDPNAIHYGYKFPYVHYDDTLKKYGEWLMTLKSETQTVIDLHTAINSVLAERRKEQVSYHVAPDAVHPNSTGHWLMAQTLLTGLSAPALVDEVEIDASKKSISKGLVRDLEFQGDTLSFFWKSKLPLPIHPKWDTKTLDLIGTNSKLSQYSLSIKNLTEEKYELFADKKSQGTFTKEELANGIDLMSLKEFPTHKSSSQILEWVIQRRSKAYRDWRNVIKGEEPSSTVAAEVASINGMIKRWRKPRVVAVQLKPVSK